MFLCMDYQFVWSFEIFIGWSINKSIIHINWSMLFDHIYINFVRQQYMWYSSFDHTLIKSNDICSYWMIDV